MRGPYPPLRRRASHAISRHMTQRATQRPSTFAKPAHWSDAPPPAPSAAPPPDEELSPTRYGDWVKDGLAIDF